MKNMCPLGQDHGGQHHHEHHQHHDNSSQGKFHLLKMTLVKFYCKIKLILFFEVQQSL